MTTEIIPIGEDKLDSKLYQIVGLNTQCIEMDKQIQSGTLSDHDSDILSETLILLRGQLKLLLS